MTPAGCIAPYAFSVVARKALDGKLYQLRDNLLPKSLPPRSVRLQIQDVVRDLLHLSKLFREGSMVRHILRSTVQITLHLLFSQGARVAQIQIPLG
jgi:hypothetical protein